jgi:chromosome segregation ATPase
MSLDQPSQPNFSSSALESTKVMKAMYEAGLRLIQEDIKDLVEQIQQKMSGFTYKESETVNNIVHQESQLTSLKKEQRYLTLLLEALSKSGAEISDEEYEAIRMQVLDEQNEELRAQTIQMQGLEIDQDVEELRTKVKPVYREFSTLLHPDTNPQADKTYEQAFANLQQYYNSDNILGVGAFVSKIISKFITITEAILKTKTLSDIDKYDPEYYEKL